MTFQAVNQIMYLRNSNDARAPHFGRYDSHAAVEVVEGLREEGVYAQVLGNVAYVMVSPTAPAEICMGTMAALKRVILALDKGSFRTPPEASESVAHSV